ncbi:hypothetical protein K435DRAFT_779323 [Dendrothele bispora CBS 962.96]|uniref:F-box domain-containing protein n=1 Tax=Dendrothele bispora (strain CBS 962.96) TaxID=1314807 RepID=A0A4S8LYM0_DENBC|nr:hypothetical protein K435DRAFT_779323 [Dendrothele bispora CBS 962.96]
MTRKSAHLQSKRKADTQTDPHTTGPTEPVQKRIKSSEAQDLDEKGFEDQQVSEPSGDDVTESTSSSRNKTRVSGDSSKKAKKLVPVDERFKKVRGRLGFLHKLVTEVPLDVIFEIFAHLKPLDILRLSRTSRDLHNLLTSRSSEHVWRNARLNVEGLPPLPTDLNEIQYAKLMFDTICQGCATHCHSVFWDCRVRCCKKCVDQILFSEPLLYYKVSQTHKADFYKVIRYVPRDLIHQKLRGSMLELFLPSAFRTILDDYQQNVKVLNDEGERVDDAQKLIAWELSMKMKRNEHRRYTRLCERWSNDQRNSRSDELQEIRNQRRDRIEDRLIELGWGPDLEGLKHEGHHHSFWNHKLIRQSKPLTDRVWDRIAPTLFEQLQPTRDRRLQREQTNALKPRYEALKKCYNICIFEQNLKQSGYPPFGDVIESNIGYDIIFNTPYDQTLSEDAFDEELKMLPSFIDDWKQRKRQELIEMVQKDIPEATVDTLSLAKTVFFCRLCNDLLWYPGVLEHCCHTGPYWQRPTLDIYRGFNPYVECEADPWNKHPTRISFSPQYSMDLSSTMQACGLDPDTASREDVDSLDYVILECKSCSRPGRSTTERVFMRWSGAFLHTHRFGQSHVPTLVKPSKQLQRKVKFFEQPYNRWSRRIYTCNYCPDTPTGKKNRDYDDLCSHLRREHGKAEITRKDWNWVPSMRFTDNALEDVFLEWPVDDSNDMPQI